jgi:hypothetical protein
MIEVETRAVKRLPLPDDRVRSVANCKLKIANYENTDGG